MCYVHFLQWKIYLQSQRWQAELISLAHRWRYSIYIHSKAHKGSLYMEGMRDAWKKTSFIHSASAIKIMVFFTSSTFFKSIPKLIFIVLVTTSGHLCLLCYWAPCLQASLLVLTSFVRASSYIHSDTFYNVIVITLDNVHQH